MAANRIARDPMPDVSTDIEAIIAFWDTHSTADYEAEMEEVAFDFDLQEEVYTVALVPDLVDLLANKARAKGVTTETLVNLWLAQRLAAA